MKNRSTMQGGASILIILLMIALSAFGLLALYSARSDYKLAEKSASRTQLYYALDATARAETARLELALRGASAPGADTAMSLGWTPLPGGDSVVTKTVTQDAMCIVITLSLPPPGADEASCTVLEWRETQDRFVYPEGYDVWQG